MGPTAPMLSEESIIFTVYSHGRKDQSGAPPLLLRAKKRELSKEWLSESSLIPSAVGKKEVKSD